MVRLAAVSEPTVGDLAASIFCRDFMPVYEPIVHLASGVVLGWQVEGRWIHPTQGVLPREAYAARAEEVGLSDPIDDIVVDRALRRFRRWSGGRGSDVTQWLGIPIPGRRLAGSALQQWILPLLGEYTITPPHVMLEISGLPEGLRRNEVIDNVGAWRDLGGAIAVSADVLGDPVFDTKRARFDVVTLDVAWLGQPCVQAILDRAARCGADVVAEGVATDDQWRTLVDLGCDAGRGPLFGGPDPELVRPPLPVRVA